MAQTFVNSKIQSGKVVVFIKPTCPYCKRTPELLNQLPFKQGLLEFVSITANSDTNEIQDYLQQLTGARTNETPPDRKITFSDRAELGMEQHWLSHGWPRSPTLYGLDGQTPHGSVPETQGQNLQSETGGLSFFTLVDREQTEHPDGPQANLLPNSTETTSPTRGFFLRHPAEMDTES
ncbi:hypothetical protein E5288_WYG021832 [Bos mutus]|uniref:Glutaredoxin-1 n=1 Tax=Bos mutus TaxID=72004 RepID=A0A6B0SAU8_9CETA|nr:hypothetical protein [Bos mutus]